MLRTNLKRIWYLSIMRRVGNVIFKRFIPTLPQVGLILLKVCLAPLAQMIGNIRESYSSGFHKLPFFLYLFPEFQHFVT